MDLSAADQDKARARPGGAAATERGSGSREESGTVGTIPILESQSNYEGDWGENLQSFLFAIERNKL